jgi:O-antigen ligase
VIPYLATGAFVAAIAALFRLDREERRPSAATWIPACWFAICGSRNVSEWLVTGQARVLEGAYLEGSPLDRTVLAMLMALALGALSVRRERTVAALRANPTIALFVLYCGISLFWSDFPGVGVRRLFRMIGDILMLLVVLTEAEPLVGLRHVLKRVVFVLVPASILLMRYFPDLGRAYGQDGTLFNTGVAGGKNGLGMMCLIFGISSVWRFLTLYRTSRGAVTRQSIAHGIIIVATLFLLWRADSMTSLACYMLASALLVVATKRARNVAGASTEPVPPPVLGRATLLVRHPALVHVSMLALIAAALSVLFLGASPDVLTTMGRDPTLTGRTFIWSLALSYAENPWVGAGFETFWLGDRIVEISNRHNFLSQAHNGYIETYLNLGWIGIAMLISVIVSAYRHTSATLHQKPEYGTLRLAYLLIALVYNCTEGAFKFMTPVWIGFLVATLNPPASPAPLAENEAASIPSAQLVPARHDDWWARHPVRTPRPQWTELRAAANGGSLRGSDVIRGGPGPRSHYR